MRKYVLIGILGVLMFSVFVMARPNLTPVLADVVTSNGHASVVIPEHAVEVSSGVFSLGTAIHDGKIVEGYMFIDYKERGSHRPGHNKGGVTNTCFAFLANGAKWKSVEDYIVSANNNAGLGDAFVRNTIASAVSKWEDASDGVVDGLQGANIIGDEVAGIVDGADTNQPDGKNEVLFGDVANSGALAVTIVWGIFRGPPNGRELVEWDQVYDDVDFVWSDAGEAEKYDFESVVTHEKGHAVGMDHPSDDCTEETMYRFVAKGETKKRSLNAGDIAGVKGLYF